jgi:hypothetical protein
MQNKAARETGLSLLLLVRIGVLTNPQKLPFLGPASMAEMGWVAVSPLFRKWPFKQTSSWRGY